MTPILFLAIVVLGMAAVIVVVTLPDPRRARLVGLAEALVRYSAVAALAALTSGLMYTIQAVSGSVIALAVGDGMMVLAGWTMWTALSAVNGRARIPPFVASMAAATSTLVSFLVPETESTAVKLLLVGAGCLALGTESVVGRMRRSSVYGLFAGVGFGFGGYMIARVAIIALLGTDSLIYERAFTVLTSTVVSGLAVIAASAGVVGLYRQLTSRPSRNTGPAMVSSIAMQVLSHGRNVTLYEMTVPDVDLVRAAHGGAAAEALSDALVEAATTCFPSGVFAVSADDSRLVAVEAERRGAGSVAADLIAVFDRAVERSGLADLTEVDVTRHVVDDPATLRAVLQPLETVARRKVLT